MPVYLVMSCFMILLSDVMSEWIPSSAGRQFQSGKTQYSSLFDVSSLPWSQCKSLTPGAFGAGGDSLMSKPGKLHISLELDFGCTTAILCAQFCRVALLMNKFTLYE